MKGEEFQFLHGLTIEEAKTALANLDPENPYHPKTQYPIIYVRPVVVDGKPQIVTMDLRLDRIDVWINDGKITYVKGIG